MNQFDTTIQYQKDPPTLVTLREVMACGNWMYPFEIEKLVEDQYKSSILKVILNRKKTFELDRSSLIPMIRLKKPLCEHIECKIRFVLES